MTQSLGDKLGSLKEAVAGLPSGSKLIDALQKNEGTSIPVELIATVVSEARKHGEKGVTAPARVDFSSASSILNQLQFISPRGKQDLAFLSDRFVIKNAKADVVVPFEAVQTIVILDAIPKDTKGKVMLYIHLKKGSKVMNGKKELSAVLIQVLASQELQMDHPTVKGQRLEGPAAVVLCQAFGAALSPQNVFAAPDAAAFTSSQGHAGVGANIKVSSGYLFPIPAGFCFLDTPATFIPIDDIVSVEMARANGVSSTFDLYVHCKDGSSIEFLQISREEIVPLNKYITATKLAVGPPPASSDDESDADDNDKGADNDSDSDDPDDEDFNPMGDSSDEEDKGPKKKKQKKEGKDAKAEAKKGEHEEQEEEEAEDDSESDDDESSSDSDSDGSVELVDEEDFDLGQLRSMMEEEKGKK